MPFTRIEKDFLILFGGIILGIFGNLITEYVMALAYPEGRIGTLSAIISLIILAFVTFGMVAIIWNILKREPVEVEA